MYPAPQPQNLSPPDSRTTKDSPKRRDCWLKEPPLRNPQAESALHVEVSHGLRGPSL